ncbi:AbrB/MazE/SpoVT family DNA-binding domain-containing protein [Candidatus Woesearchaeota archaeon]|nr:AbrB/MazE/SpoVT family DNA-binding domain-containing protein [Candidatus Woesearchaeota archaeon]
MKRKVIKQGHNTLTITLPAKWVENNGIKSGDELDIEEKKKTLLLSSAAPKKISKSKLDADSLDLFLLKRYFNTLYKMGVDEIELTFSDPNIILSLQEILQKNLIGYEIISQTKSSCIIRSLSVINDSEFENTLRRTFLLLKSLSQETFNAIKTKDIVYFKSSSMLEENNNRLTTYCRRILNKNGYKDDAKIAFIYLIVEQLEKIADEYKYLSDQFEKKEYDLKNVSDDTIKLYGKVNSFLEEFYEIFYNYSKERTVQFSKSYREIVTKSYSLLEVKKKEEVIVLHHLMTITRDIFDILAPTIALVL